MKRRVKPKRPPALMLTSLLDMFTIILIFLIVSFEAENKEFRLNPDLTLPESQARGQLKPAVNMAITDGAVFVGDDQVFQIEGDTVPDEVVEAGKIDPLVERLKEEYEKRFGEDAFVGLSVTEGEDSDTNEPIIVIQADRQLDYKTLHVVLRSAASAGFFKYRLAVLKT